MGARNFDLAMEHKVCYTEVMKRLQTLRNIGPAMAERLCLVGITNPEQVKKSNPEELYERLRINEGGRLDICVLYQLRGEILDIPWWECKNLTKGQSGRLNNLR